MQLTISLNGADALQSRVWLHWPVCAAAYHARQPDLMWQEVDYAFRCFSHLPRTAGKFLSDLLFQLNPVSQTPLSSCAEDICSVQCHVCKYDAQQNRPDSISAQPSSAAWPMA